MKKQIKIWLEAVRLRTLPVSASGVLIAVALAKWTESFRWKPAIVCLVFAIMAQVVSNLANEYFDFKSGIDKPGRVGPRRGVTEGDFSPRTLRNVTVVMLALTCLVGLATLLFVASEQWPMLIITGVLITVFAFAYSAGPYPLSRHGLGEAAVFIFFGIVPVNFTYFVIANEFNVWSMLASITIGFMGVNVLLVNNYRDVDDDRETGKRTSVVIFGRQAAAAAYLINGYIAVAMLSPMWLLALTTRLLSGWMLLVPVIYLIMHTRAWYRLRNSEGAALNPLLGATARNMLIFTILMAVGLSWPLAGY